MRILTRACYQKLASIKEVPEICFPPILLSKRNTKTVSFFHFSPPCSGGHGKDADTTCKVHFSCSTDKERLRQQNVNHVLEKWLERNNLVFFLVYFYVFW